MNNEKPNSMDEEMIYIHFFCFHESIKDFDSFELVLKQPMMEISKYQMEKLDTDIIYAKVPFIYNQWLKNRQGVKYYYVLKATFDYKTEDITRLKSKFIDNTKYFDTPDVFKSMLGVSYESAYKRPLARYYSFFITSFLNNTPFLNDSALFHDLFQFYYSCNYDVHNDTLFETFE